MLIAPSFLVFYIPLYLPERSFLKKLSAVTDLHPFTKKYHLYFLERDWTGKLCLTCSNFTTCKQTVFKKDDHTVIYLPSPRMDMASRQRDQLDDVQMLDLNRGVYFPSLPPLQGP